MVMFLAAATATPGHDTRKPCIATVHLAGSRLIHVLLLRPIPEAQCVSLLGGHAADAIAQYYHAIYIAAMPSSELPH